MYWLATLDGITRVEFNPHKVKKDSWRILHTVAYAQGKKVHAISYAGKLKEQC